ncbi:ATPase involved in chromosome partitioning-like protein [Stackebrandtia nassauensis DSM 44728]|uniref:ATPase involved in chromosome partitioning-like protein n=1 Tax=Stackebrandtia nassauensis (strain DSM 44728 / CIP 108903 / NRRL B-16338 / NBRC 102104 / LLR-40K-21) TaxID=446470 RepID=D3PZW4_STANL|nr:AAA family ATPase [Stackebrandtia nassauensis]ADD43651.1 ATPase involved in chromosome partitioning-like protein [Stackebrandtia nassauensis DSM 44728]
MGTTDGWSAKRSEQTPRWRTLLSRSRQRGDDTATLSPPPQQDYPSSEVVPPPRQPLAWGAAEPSPGRDLSRHPALKELRRDLGRPRVIAFVNPKGGVHKTTATVLTAAALGSARGKGVIAWDDNELRGTLGLRAGTARHARTIRHLVNDLAQVEAAGTQLAEIADDYLRHSADGSFDVLAGDEDPKLAGKLDPETVLRVLDILTRTHDIICIDTGNNVESENWRTVVSNADQLVVTSVPREDAAFTADWMLDLLVSDGYVDLVANAVTLLSCPTPRPGTLLDDLTAHFKSRTRDVAVVPYDPTLEPGSAIKYSQLRDTTQDAWLNAAATIIRSF